MESTRVTVNETEYILRGDGERPLLWALHDELDLTGTGFHCLQGHCGACTVLVDGVPQRACVTPVGAVDGCRLTTIEGACASGDAICGAFSSAGLLECGMCSSGQVMSAIAQRAADASLDGDALMDGLGEHVCFCLRYGDILRALRSAVSDAGETTTSR